jgi:hypothetical protein
MPRLGNGVWNWLGCTTFLAVGCAHTNQPTGYAGPPIPGGAPVAVPAPSGCSSCGGGPVVAMPRYHPPTPAPPPIVNQPQLIGAAVLESVRPSSQSVQTLFRPVPPAVRLGTVIEEETTMPLPPADAPGLPQSEPSLPRDEAKLPYITLK